MKENYCTIPIREIKELLKQGKKVKVKTLNNDYADILEYVEKGIQRTFLVSLENNKNIKVSSKHRFFTNAGWLKTIQLEIDNHSILCADGNYSVIKSIEQVTSENIVDIRVDHPEECYFGNDMLNHNTGKSLLAYMILRDCASRGGVSVLIDTENAANIDFLRMLGLEPDKNLVYSQTDTVEDVFKIIETVITQVRQSDRNRLVTIVWDSIAGTSTRKEMNDAVGDANVALVARLMGQGLRRIKSLIGNQRICLVFLNQLRDKIGIMFGDPKTVPGGNAVPFFADVRIRLYTGPKIKAGEDIIGIQTRAKVLKTRFGPPFREAMLNVYFNRGLIDEDSWIEHLIKRKLIKGAPQKSDTTKVSKSESILAGLDALFFS